MSKTKTPIKNTSVPSAYDTPLTILEYLRKVEEQNAQVLARQDEIEEALDGKVAKSGDTMTGDLSVSNINVNNNANVGKLNSEKLNQKYEGAIKAELHVDEEGITEFVNGSNAGRFDTARVIKPTEVKTEIYDNQQGKRMFFRLPYLEASAGEHRLLTEEDLGGGGSSDEFTVIEGNINNDKFASGFIRLAYKKNVLLLQVSVSSIVGTGLGDPITLGTIHLTSEIFNDIISKIGSSIRNTYIAIDGTLAGSSQGFVMGNAIFPMNASEDIRIYTRYHTGTYDTSGANKLVLDGLFIGHAQ